MPCVLCSLSFKVGCGVEDFYDNLSSHSLGFQLLSVPRRVEKLMPQDVMTFINDVSIKPGSARALRHWSVWLPLHCVTHSSFHTGFCLSAHHNGHF